MSPKQAAPIDRKPWLRAV